MEFNQSYHQQAYWKGRKLICHYTKPETLFLILSNLKLKFSSFENLNDLNESEVNFQISDIRLSAIAKEEIIKTCKILSFTKDKINRKGFINSWALNHARMWAQYADNNEGACIILDEDSLIKDNPFLANRNKTRIEDVKYKIWKLEDREENTTDFKDFIFKNYRTLFFTKHLDWRDESERRIFQYGNHEFLNIENSIEYICLGFRFNKYELLIDFLIKNSKTQKRNFLPHMFVKQFDNGGRIITHPATREILERCNQQKDYLKFLEINGYQ